MPSINPHLSALRARIAADALQVEESLDGVGIRHLTQARESGLQRAAVSRIEQQLSSDVRTGIPELEPDGFLPNGIWRMGVADLGARFGGNPVRDALLSKLELAVGAAHRTGARHVIVGGSFLSAKPVPGDVDGVLLGRTGSGAWRAGVTPGSPIPKIRHLGDVRLDDDVPLDIYDGRWVLADEVGRSMNSLNFAGGRVQRGETMLELFRHDRTGAMRGVALLEP